VSENGTPPVGSKAWEAKLEIQKLPNIIADRSKRLTNENLTPQQRTKLEQEVTHLEHQLDGYKKDFKAMDKDPGKGFVEAKGVASKGIVPAPKVITKKIARKQVMQEEGIPKSQQPISQSRNESGREYQYEFPKPGGGVEIKSVQQQTLDSSHPGQGHWEAGAVKTDPVTGEIRMNNYGRPKLVNDKSKVDYDD
jgi:hypothetical protein